MQLKPYCVHHTLLHLLQWNIHVNVCLLAAFIFRLLVWIGFNNIAKLHEQEDDQIEKKMQLNAMQMFLLNPNKLWFYIFRLALVL